MRRNLFIIIGIFLAVLALMVTGNIIIIGEKIGQVTHLWWLEYVFYGLILVLMAYFILYPIVRIHRAQQFPVLGLDEHRNMQQLTAFGHELAGHCDFISDENTNPDGEERKSLRVSHQRELREQLAQAAGNEQQLREVIHRELELRFKGNRNLGVLGINGRIREWAKSVFMISAISQNSRFDTFSVMYLNFRMISDIIQASGFRPTNRQLVRMYASILTTALITYAVSEALTTTGSVAPFDFGDLDSSADALPVDDVADVNPDDMAIMDAADADGLSVYSVLRRIKIPGIVVSAALDGTVNALMTLRIGYVTRAYLRQGSKALKGVHNKRAVKRQAMMDAITNVPAVIASGSGVIGKRTSNLIIHLIKKDNPATSGLKKWRDKLLNLYHSYGRS